MRIATGIDLPSDAPGGSVELLRDLYLGPAPLVEASVFMLRSSQPASDGDRGSIILDVDGKTLNGTGFWSYVDALSVAIRNSLTAPVDVIHLQHLTFGATPALLHAFPALPSVALVHGTDLLLAETHSTQASVLQSTVTTTDAVIVPSLAMADRLSSVTTTNIAHKIVHIPWGIPDRLLGSELAPRARVECAPFRILYAGRLASEKATAPILGALSALDNVELSVAAPSAEYRRWANRPELSDVRHLGWLSRPELWREFTRHDLLVVPSLTLEAFGLVAIEAQACGLPVAYQAVPGLSEVLRDSAWAVDFQNPEEVAQFVKNLQTSRSLLDELRWAGRENSARFPLSATARSLRELSLELLT